MKRLIVVTSSVDAATQLNTAFHALTGYASTTHEGTLHLVETFETPHVRTGSLRIVAGVIIGDNVDAFFIEK